MSTNPQLQRTKQERWAARNGGTMPQTIWVLTELYTDTRHWDEVLTDVQTFATQEKAIEMLRDELVEGFECDVDDWSAEDQVGYQFENLLGKEAAMAEQKHDIEKLLRTLEAEQVAFWEYGSTQYTLAEQALYGTTA